MANIYFHPDIDYQGIKDIENKYTCIDSDYLINEASKHGKIVVLLNSDEWLRKKKGKECLRASWS